MNVIFCIATSISLVFLLFNNPEKMLEVFSSAPKKAVDLSLVLIGVYTVWQGFSLMLEKSGISSKISKAFKKPISKPIIPPTYDYIIYFFIVLVKHIRK